MLEAEQRLAPAKIGTGIGLLNGVTSNRRSGVSPYVTTASIDEQLGIIRVDALDGTPIATVWNYAIHGLSYGIDNHEFSADIMGAASKEIEGALGGVALFINSAEGDITPVHRGANTFKGAKLIADAVLASRAQITANASMELAVVSESVNFGAPTLNVSTVRAGLVSGGPLNILGFLSRNNISPSFALLLDPTWVENEARFMGLRINRTLLTTIPGEGVLELGLQIRKDGKALGFDNTFVCGLANNHLSYIATEREYYVGGYEALATMFGPKTAEQVRDACRRVATRVRP